LRVVNADKRPGRCQSLLELGSDVPSGDRVLQVFHMLFGTRCRPFPLASRGPIWPRVFADVEPDDLGLIGSTPEVPGKPNVGGQPVRLRVLSRIAVAGRPALLLRVKPYPAGGVHGGHVVVLWNASGRGYVVSLHFEGGQRSERDAIEEATTKAVARASVPGPAR
jgi:hypothetical protein